MDQEQNKRHGQAIASMVLGILSIVFMGIPYVGCALALMAVIFSALVLNGGVPVNEPGGTRGMAIAGLVMGILGLVVGIPYALGVSCVCAMLPSVAFYW